MFIQLECCIIPFGSFRFIYNRSRKMTMWWYASWIWRIWPRKNSFWSTKANVLDEEMTKLIDWFNEDSSLDPVLKAEIVHLWFVAIHLFEDGNGRIARAIADLQLSRADDVNQRFYSMPTHILNVRKSYYEVLKKT